MEILLRKGNIRKLRLFLFLCCCNIVVVGIFHSSVFHKKLKPAKKWDCETPVIDGNYILCIPSYAEIKHINSNNPESPFVNRFTFLLENQNLCQDVKNLSLVIVIESAPSHFEWRKVIRQTWTNGSHYPYMGTFRLLFLFGKIKDTKLQLQIEREFKQHGDILQGDFVDSYTNLTYHTVMGWQWLIQHCRNAKLILKADDDVVVDMYKMWTKVLASYISKTRSIYCQILDKSMIVRWQPQKFGIMDDSFLTGEVYFPPYCEGKLVLMTNDLIPHMYKIAQLLPFFPLEDVFAYGFVTRHMPGLTFDKYIWGVDFHFHRENVMKCLWNSLMNCSYYVSHAHSKTDIKETWDLFEKRHKLALA